MNIVEIRLENHSAEFTQEMRQATIRFLEEAGLFLEGQCSEALEMDPRRVDTGRLKGSIGHKPVEAELAVYVGTNVEYAYWVHEGTRKMDPNRFLKNGFMLNKEQIGQKYEQALKNA